MSKISDLLQGDKAFYKQVNYVAETQRDFASQKPLPVCYKWNSERKITRILKTVISIVIFPIAIGKLIHSLAGLVYFPAPIAYSAKKLTSGRKNAKVHLDEEWKYKRLTIQVDGCKIDAVIIGKESTFNNKRWMLESTGNCGCYEARLIAPANLHGQLDALQSNAILFNYPALGSSSGMPSRKILLVAYRAMLKFLEDEQNGIGAKEIIGYGLSLGGGVQGDALKHHRLKKGIKYVFVKDRTFSRMNKEADLLFFKPLGFITKLIGWNMSSFSSSSNMPAHEIILQTANVRKPEELGDSSKIIDDGVISKDASLAKKLLDKGLKNNKTFFGIPQSHNTPIWNYSFLAKKINEVLAG